MIHCKQLQIVKLKLTDRQAEQRQNDNCIFRRKKGYPVQKIVVQVWTFDFDSQNFHFISLEPFVEWLTLRLGIIVLLHNPVVLEHQLTDWWPHIFLLDAGQGTSLFDLKAARHPHSTTIRDHICDALVRWQRPVLSWMFPWIFCIFLNEQVVGGHGRPTMCTTVTSEFHSSVHLLLSSGNKCTLIKVSKRLQFCVKIKKHVMC